MPPRNRVAPLARLFAENRGKGAYRIENAGGEATIWIYDFLVDSEEEASWWGGVSAEGVAKEIASLDVSTINLRINSPGGSVFAGRAIEAAIRASKAKTVAYVDGLAASAASYIAIAADEVVIQDGAFFMIHCAAGICWGNAADMVDYAALLEKIDGSIAGTYARRAGGEADEWLEKMQAETWFTADEAVAAGLANRIADGEDVEAENVGGWNLSAFAHAPAAAVAIRMPPAKPANENTEMTEHRHRQIRAALAIETA